jgi:hypothetical protein
MGYIAMQQQKPQLRQPDADHAFVAFLETTALHHAHYEHNSLVSF